MVKICDTFTLNPKDIKYGDSVATKSVKSLREELSELIADWMAFTTIHGLSRILNAKYVALKLMWLVCFLMGMGITIYLIATTIQVYFEYNEITNTQIVSDLPSQFPTVTVCNLNPYFVSYLWPSQQSDYYHSCNATHSQCEQILQDSMLKCMYNGMSCKRRSDFNIFFSNENYFCFEFNYDKNNLKKVSRNGAQNGFQLSLYLGDPNYAVSDKLRGLRIYVHNSTEDFPNIDRSYVEAAPGFKTNIAVKRTFYQKLSEPYTH